MQALINGFLALVVLLISGVLTMLGFSFWPSVIGAFLIIGVGSLLLVTSLAGKAEVDVAANLQREIEQHFAENPDHVTVLGRIFRRSVYVDEFGDDVFEDWHREFRRYVDTKMSWLFDEPDEADYRAVREVLGNIPKFIELADGDDAEVPVDPREFEAWCARCLREQGFHVQEIGGSGDQGADLIASAGDLRIALQCKKHSAPVGNGAVQEVESARRFYDCKEAIVVGDSGFTRAARQLASKLGVMLLSSDDLTSVADEQITEERAEEVSPPSAEPDVKYPDLTAFVKKLDTDRS